MLNIHELRTKKGLTQIELAKKIGVKSNTISNYEGGKRVPNAVMLKKISQALDCSVDDLLKENLKEEG